LHSDISQGASYWRSAMHVRLEYCLVRLFIGRPFLLHRNYSHSNSRFSPESQDMNGIPSTAGTTTEGGKKRISRRLELVNDCVQAALEALQICQSLRDGTPGLARASYIEYSSCRASLLVLIAYSIQDEICQFHDVLQRGLDMICEMSTAGDSARSEVSLIESLERALSRLQLLNTGTSGDNGVSGSPGGYDSFKYWEFMWKSSNPTTDTTSRDVEPDRLAVPQSEQPSGSTRLFEQIGQNARNNSTTLDVENALTDVHFSTQSNSEPNLTPFGSLHSTTGLGFFAGESIPLSPAGFLHPETQLLEDFLTDSGSRFNAAPSADFG
jgi:hypothetical protein